VGKDLLDLPSDPLVEPSDGSTLSPTGFVSFVVTRGMLLGIKARAEANET
jgi:hypothetical protein